MSRLSASSGGDHLTQRLSLNHVIDLIGRRVTYPVIGFVTIIMAAIVWSDPVWVWINNDEEEDTVRFRQRLSFCVFWFIVVGLIHVRNSFVIKKV